jgi:hypothetical protein
MPIFISYSHQDSDFAIKLASQLVQHKAHVWIDKWELQVGDSIIARIQDAIENASALLVILSKASVESEWCKVELESGLHRELDEKRVVVLPVLLEDCDIPPFLKRKIYADFRKNYDKGLQSILTAVASITSDSLGRHKGDKLHVDWSVDHGVIEGNFALEITVVEQATNVPYSTLTTIRIIGDDNLTQRHQMFDDAGLGWFHRTVTICSLAMAANEQDTRLLLEDENRKETNFVMSDPKSGVHWVAHVTSRRLGMDTGQSILIDIGGQLNIVCNDLGQTLRKLNSEELKKIEEIQVAHDMWRKKQGDD